MTSVALVTGTSSGIGEAVARDLLARGWRVAGVSRRASPIADASYLHLRLDVGDFPALTAALDERVAPLLADAERIALVNNAASESLVGTVSTLDAAALIDVYRVNSAAPVLLMGWFQRHAKAGQPLRIVNVSTGAATAPFPGLAAYGSTKAALRLSGMVMAAELDAAASSGARVTDTTILSFEPGRVDTPMQEHARSASPDIFPLAPLFKEWHDTGVLLPPALPASQICDYVESDGHPRWREARVSIPS